MLRVHLVIQRGAVAAETDEVRDAPPDGAFQVDRHLAFDPVMILGAVEPVRNRLMPTNGGAPEAVRLEEWSILLIDEIHATLPDGSHGKDESDRDIAVRQHRPVLVRAASPA